MNGPTWLQPHFWDLLSARRPRAPVSDWPLELRSCPNRS